MGKEFTTEQIQKIVAEGSHDLGYHEGVCDVLTKLKELAKMCSDEGEPWILTPDEVKGFAEEEFNVDIK